MRLTVSGAELRPGDVILHPMKGGNPRRVYEVVEQPRPSPGSWSLRCRVREVASGKAVEIAVGPTTPFTIDREG